MAAALALALTGCQVHTQITVDGTGAGRGVMSVSVSLDRTAVGAIGGSAALAAQLQATDLRAAGWIVTGPAPGPGSTTVVTASHTYTTAAQAGALVGELAGGGPTASRPFRLSLSQRHTFWRTDTILSGQIDLTCGLGCFGDSGLTKALGFPTGVNASALAAAAGQHPDQVFTFGLDAHLRGAVVSSNTASHAAGTFRWTTGLGQTLALAAVTRTWNSGRIMTVSVAGAVVVVGVLSLLVLWWWRRRRRRRQGDDRSRRQGDDRSRSGRHRRGLHRKGRGRVPEAVAPPT